MPLYLALTACGDRPDDEADRHRRVSAPASETAAAVDFKACMVSDSGGFDDKSFNQTSFKGLTDARDQARRADGAGRIGTSDAEYADNIMQLIAAGLQPDHHGRLPPRRRHPGGRQGEP